MRRIGERQNIFNVADHIDITCIVGDDPNELIVDMVSKTPCGYELLLPLKGTKYEVKDDVHD